MKPFDVFNVGISLYKRPKNNEININATTMRRLSEGEIQHSRQTLTFIQFRYSFSCIFASEFNML